MLNKLWSSANRVSNHILGISALIAIVFVAGCGSGSSAQFGVTTTSGQLATVVISSAYPQTTLTAANGTAPYTWTVSGGALPTGMALSSAGVLSGTPTAFGTFSFTVTVTDSATPTPHTATASLNVMVNPAITSVALNPTAVPGGTASTATVTLSGAAAAAASVTLASSNAAATVPATVTVAAGQTTATFQVTTTAVSASASATITATYGVAKTATLTVNPPTVTSVVLTQSTVTGGLGTTATVTLSGPAATGGDSVALSSDNVAAVVPATVTVLAGQSTAQFNVTTTSVLSSATAHIQGTFNSSSAPTPATLTIVPAPVVTSFTAAATTITTGSSTTLTAVFSNGTGSVNNGVGAVTSGTAKSVSPTVTTTYTLTVTNAAGSTVTSTVKITVNTPPQITSANSATFTVGVNGTFTVTTTGTPTPSLSITTGSLPSPLTFHDNTDGTATISGIPTGASVTPITITASNGFLPNATQSFTLSVTAVSCSTNCTISGTVTGPNASGVAIALTGPATANTTTNSSGFYSFTGLAGGTYVVTPTLAGYTFSPSAPSVPTTGSTTTQDFTEASAVSSFSISGTISYAGAKTGNTIIRVYPSGCTGSCSSLAGTSFTSAPALGGTAYTIRGLPAAGSGGSANGSYMISAEIDTVGTGILNESNPKGASGTVNITTANITGVNFSVADRVPSTPVTPTHVSVAPGNGAAVVQYNDSEDSSGEEIATSYKVYYGTDVNATNGTGSPKTFKAQGHGTDLFILKGLPNGLTYFKVSAVNSITESAPTTPVSATLAAGAGANTVSGTVTFPGTATGHTMYVGVYGNNGIYFTAITSPVSPQAYSIAGVPSGTYQNFAILDLNDDGEVNPPDISDVTNHSNPPTIVVSGSTTGNITLASATALISVPTSVMGASGQLNPTYSISVQVDYGTKLPISITLISGKNVAVPYDMNADSHNANYNPIYLNTVSPTVGDTYQFQVTFSDGTTQVVTSTVSAVLTSFAQNLVMQTTSPGSVTVPLLTWTAPAVLPTALPYTYSVSLSNSTTFWNYYGSGNGNGIPSSQTSALYNTDGSASPNAPLVSGTYNWSVFVQDNNNNQSVYTTTYVVP